MSTSPDSGRSLGQLVASATQDVSTIVKGEIALAKLEMSSQVKKAGRGAVFLAIAGVIGFFLVFFLFMTLAFLIASLFSWSVWMGFGIVSLLMIIVAAVFALLGIKKVKTVDPKPSRAIADAEKTVATLKGAKVAD